MHVAARLGDGLPADWHDKVAVEARQDCLAGLAHDVVKTAIDALTHLMELRCAGLTPRPVDPIIVTLARELMTLDAATRNYVRATQRDDWRCRFVGSRLVLGWRPSCGLGYARHRQGPRGGLTGLPTSRASHTRARWRGEPSIANHATMAAVGPSCKG